MSALAWIALGLLSAAPAKVKVVVVPLEAHGVSWESSRAATQNLVAVLPSLPGIAAVTAESVASQIGIDIGEQARLCNREIFCLVQIGEAASADKLLVGELSREGAGGVVLRLRLIDVAKAAMIDTLRWQLPPHGVELGEAIPAALRQLLTPPDTRLILEITPKDAKVRFYGEPVEKPFFKDVPYWSGLYYAEVRRDGHEPRELRVQLQPGGPVRVVVTLVPDPLYVAPKSSRPHGEVTTAVPPREPALVEPAIAPRPNLPPVEGRPSPLANFYAWGLIAGGGTAGVVGALIRKSAQSDYNAYSSEVRFTNDQTHTVADARAVRDGARSGVTTGSTVMVVGIATGAAGVAWMIVDAILATSGAGRIAATPTLESGGAGCALSF